MTKANKWVDPLTADERFAFHPRREDLLVICQECDTALPYLETDQHNCAEDFEAQEDLRSLL